jgi:hypothetical protein
VNECDYYPRTCQFCRKTGDVSVRPRTMVKYGVRHYAHGPCLVEAKGLDEARVLVPEHERDDFNLATTPPKTPIRLYPDTRRRHHDLVVSVVLASIKGTPVTLVCASVNQERTLRRKIHAALGKVESTSRKTGALITFEQRKVEA